MTLNKYERIALVKKLGLNTEENILVETSNDLKCQFIRSNKKLSLRTFYRNDDIKNTPHYPVITSDRLKKIAPKLIRDGLSLIVAKRIDPKDCLFRGAAWKKRKEIFVEIAEGPGTVRTVTHECKIDKTFHIKYNTSLSKLSKEMRECLKNFRSVGLSSVIFEFSYYKIPIGWKSENFICWEITSSGERGDGVRDFI